MQLNVLNDLAEAMKALDGKKILGVQFLDLRKRMVPFLIPSL